MLAPSRPVMRMHAPRKTGEVVITPDQPWEGVIFYYDSIVQVSADEFRIYYECVRNPPLRPLLACLWFRARTLAAGFMGRFSHKGPFSMGIVGFLGGVVRKMA